MIVDQVVLEKPHTCPKCKTALIGQESVAGGAARIRILCPGCKFVGAWTMDEAMAWDLFSASMEVAGVHHRP